MFVLQCDWRACIGVGCCCLLLFSFCGWWIAVLGYLVCYLGWTLVWGFAWFGIVFGYVWLFAGVSCNAVLAVWMGL